MNPVTGALEKELMKIPRPFTGDDLSFTPKIKQSDMLLVPDPSTAILDTFKTEQTVSVLCNVKDPISGEWYDSSPRTVAMRAMEYLKASNVADMAYFGPEAEFFIFDSVKYD